MSEPTAVAESVTSTDASVTVDPAQLNKPVHPSAQDESTDLLKHKLGLANAHAKQAKKEKDDLQRQFDELKAQMAQVQDAQQSAVRQNLEDQGAFRELYEQEKARAKQLRLLSGRALATECGVGFVTASHILHKRLHTVIISGETLCWNNCQLIGMSLIGLARQVQKNRD